MLGWRRWVVLCIASLALPAGAAARSTPATMAQASQGCVVQVDPSAFEDEVPDCPHARSLLGARSVAVSPDGKHVYVGAQGGSSGESEAERSGRGGIAEFSRGAGGSLTQTGCITNDSGNGLVDTHGACSQGDGLQSADSIALAPDGTGVYAVSRDRSSLLGFSRNAGSGLLEQFACVSVIPLGRCTLAFAILRASSVVVSPDGKSVYVGSSALLRGDLQTDSIAIFARDPATGAIDERSCLSEDGSDGSCTIAKGIAGVDAMAMSPDGADLYTVSGNAVASFRRDAATGALKQTGCTTAAKTSCTKAENAARPTSIAVSPDGKNVYVSSSERPAVVTYSRDASTGALQYRSCNATPPDPELDDTKLDCAAVKGAQTGSAIAVTPDGRTVLVAGSSPDDEGTVTTLSRDSGNGDLTPAGCLTADEAAKDLGCGTLADLFAPEEIAVSPDSANAYVVDSSSSAVFVLAVAATVSQSSARVDRRGRAHLVISCPAAKSSRCRGSVRLAHARHLRAVSRTRRFAARAGGVARVAVPLVHRRTRGRIVAVVTDATGAVRPVTRRVVLRR